MLFSNPIIAGTGASAGSAAQAGHAAIAAAASKLQTDGVIALGITAQSALGGGSSSSFTWEVVSQGSDTQ